MMKHTHESGFTLLEVAITIGILMTLTLAVTELLSANLEIRGRVSQSGKVSHRLSSAMERLSYDVSHAFVLTKTEETYRKSDRRPTLFSFDTRGNSSELKMTTTGHRPLIANAKESDLTYIVYRVEEDPEFPGFSNLYRGELPFIPKSLKEDPPMRIVARFVKALRIEAWRGDRWVKDRWDTTRSDTKSQLPQLIKMEVDGWLVQPLDAEDAQATDVEKAPVETYSTVVHVPAGSGFVEDKSAASTIPWGRL